MMDTQYQDNPVIEPFSFVMADNDAWWRIVPDSSNDGNLRWHVELSAEELLSPQSNHGHPGKPVPTRVVLFYAKVTPAHVLRFIPWNYWYVPGNFEDSFLHYLESCNDEFGWIPKQIREQTQAINEELLGDTPFRQEMVNELRNLVQTGEVLKRTLFEMIRISEERHTAEHFHEQAVNFAKEARRYHAEHKQKLDEMKAERRYEVQVWKGGNDITDVYANHDTIDGNREPFNKSLGSLTGLDEDTTLAVVNQILDQCHDWGQHEREAEQIRTQIRKDFRGAGLLDTEAYETPDGPRIIVSRVREES